MTDLNSGRTCLHLIVSTGESAMSDCLQQCCEGDSIVFLDVGVLHLLGSLEQSALPDNVNVCFSLEDLQARGLLETANRQGVQVKDARAVASLLLEHEHCLTWT